MQFRILGSIEVEDNGLRIDLGGLRERALLACLLLSANRVVSAGRLAEDLWSGSPPPHSTATLRVYIARLRRVLGPQAGLLVTQAPGYRLNVEDDQLDALRFEVLVRAAEADMAAGRRPPPRPCGNPSACGTARPCRTCPTCPSRRRMPTGLRKPG